MNFQDTCIAEKGGKQLASISGSKLARLSQISLIYCACSVFIKNKLNVSSKLFYYIFDLRKKILNNINCIQSGLQLNLSTIEIQIRINDGCDSVRSRLTFY